MKIVMVCAGNLCRSPMAEALLREKLARRGIGGVNVSSCGLEAEPGRSAEPTLKQVIGAAYQRLNGFRTRPISDEIVGDADLVLAMEERQVREIVSRFPDARGKVATVASYAGGDDDITDFIDGYQGSFLQWLESCYSRLDASLDRIVKKLSENNASTKRGVQ